MAKRTTRFKEPEDFEKAVVLEQIGQTVKITDQQKYDTRMRGPGKHMTETKFANAVDISKVWNSYGDHVEGVHQCLDVDFFENRFYSTRYGGNVQCSSWYRHFPTKEKLGKAMMAAGLTATEIFDSLIKK